jgi:SAM-dependent methyltransferase
VRVVTDDDRRHWNERHAAAGLEGIDRLEPPPVFAAREDLFPTTGRALDIACGRGRASVWLADRGMTVVGLDVSPVAIELADELAARNASGERCTFVVADLDRGLPSNVTAGPPFDLVLCHLFRQPALDGPVVERLAPGGLLAVAVLSEVGVGPGRFRARPGELRNEFAHLELEADGQADGLAWLLATKPRGGDTSVT